MNRPPRAVVAPIVRHRGQQADTDQDLVAVESPLEILIERGGGAAPHSLGLVMRTPGDDRDLVRGLLFTEQLISASADVIEFAFEEEVSATAGDRSARVHVTLAAGVPDPSVASRALDRTSACGMCGRLAMQTLNTTGALPADAPQISAAVIAGLPDQLRDEQAVFDKTGGLHAAAFCGLDGAPWVVREDVGRHNAVDKVIGAGLAAGRIPATTSLLVVSGRVAYEIVQKASLAGVIGIVAVGAPTSLAIEAARSVGLTLAGFTRDGRFNVYAGNSRVR